MWHDLAGPDLDQNAFAEWLYQMAQMVSEAYVIVAPNKGKEIPVALVTVVERRVWLEPHIDFFSWASDRNKIETAVRLVLELRKIKPLFIVVERDHQSWTDHVLKYGVIRRSGTHNPTNRVLYESGVKHERA